MVNEAKYYRDLGQRISVARRKRGLTQEGLASLVGLTRTSMVNIEKGRQKVLAHTLMRLSQSLQMKAEELAPTVVGIGKIEDLLRGLPESDRKFVKSAVAPTERSA